MQNPVLPKLRSFITTDMKIAPNFPQTDIIVQKYISRYKTGVMMEANLTCRSLKSRNYLVVTFTRLRPDLELLNPELWDELD